MNVLDLQAIMHTVFISCCFCCNYVETCCCNVWNTGCWGRAGCRVLIESHLSPTDWVFGPEMEEGVVVVVIPATPHSPRLPQKPLHTISEKKVVLRVRTDLQKDFSWKFDALGHNTWHNYITIMWIPLVPTWQEAEQPPPLSLSPQPLQ